MRVCAFDPLVPADAFAAGVEAVSLAELLAAAEFVSLHARATAENENMIGAAELAAMRPGAFFVNTARESLVDEAALHAALVSGHLAGAALDVVRPAAGGMHPLLTLRNVVVTPHIGGATAETIDRGIAMIADEIDALRERRAATERAVRTGVEHPPRRRAIGPQIGAWSAP